MPEFNHQSEIRFFGGSASFSFFVLCGAFRYRSTWHACRLRPLISAMRLYQQVEKRRCEVHTERGDYESPLTNGRKQSFFQPTACVWLASKRFRIRSLLIAKLEVRMQSSGVMPETEWSILALGSKPRAARLDGAVSRTFSKLHHNCFAASTSANNQYTWQAKIIR